MTDTACMWRGHEKPRTLRGRHLDSCPNEDDCRGCQPCTEPHCTVCGSEHAVGVCPTCLADTRDRLGNLALLRGRLGAELAARPKAPGSGVLEGVPGGVLMFLDGPVADPEAYAHRSTAALHRAHEALPRSAAARAADHLRDEHDSDDEPPTAMLIWWEDKWRDLAGHEPRDGGPSTYYLDEQLAWAAENDPAFKDFRRDLGHQIARVEDALHDGERPDTGAPCLLCGANQEKHWGETAEADRWICPRCKNVNHPTDYARSTAAEARAFADWLNGSAMEDEHGIKYGTLRVWANRGDVRKRGRDSNGRILYSVKDAVAMRDRKTRQDGTQDAEAEVV